MNIENKKTRYCGFHLPESVLNQFQTLYPQLATVFVRRCLLRAFDNKEFFDVVFFTTKDSWSKLGSNNPNYNKDI